MSDKFTGGFFYHGKGVQGSRIIHLTGTMGSGKTSLLRELAVEHAGIFAHFDLREFYEQNGCFDAKGKMDWNKWSACADTIPEALDGFVKRHRDKKFLVVESSGVNWRVNEWLKQKNFDRIALQPPDENQLKEYAKHKGIPYKVVNEFLRNWYEKTSYVREDLVPYDKAKDYLSEQFNIARENSCDTP